MLHPLENPPESKSWILRDLVAAARKGRLRVPPFQRGLRWDSSDVRELLDSIRHGYPIGTLLLWKRKEPAPACTVKFGPVAFDAAQTSDALWVVDGQQRTTALTAALLHPSPDPKIRADTYEFYFDLEAEAFVRRSARVIPPETWLPLWEMGDSNRLLVWLDQHNAVLDEAHKNTAIRVANSIQEYQVPSVIVETENDRVLREIFRRTNNMGRRLSQNEVFQALYIGSPGEQPSSLAELSEALSDLPFGNLEKLPYRQIVLGMRGVEPTRNIRTLRFDEPDWKGALAEATGALRRAIVFLKNEVGIPVAQLVPYAAFFTLLARFFQQFAEPGPRPRELLARWVWRAAVSAQFRGDATKIRAAFHAIKESDEASVQRLLHLLPRTHIALDPDFDLRTSSGKLIALALLHVRPRDLETGAVLDVQQLFAEADANPFARIVRNPENRPKAPGNCLVVAAPSRTGWDKRVAAALKSASLTTLQSHLISPAAVEIFSETRWEGFLQVRNQAVAVTAREFLAVRTRLNETDRPSLEAIASVEG